MIQAAQKVPYFDPKFKAECINLLPGEFYTTGSEQMIMTILGSCVSACVRDVQSGIGGMNHFLLAKPSDSLSSPSARYGSYAMECLVNDILRRGGKRDRLEVKIFGGSDLISSSVKIGSKNCEFIKTYLRNEGFKVTAEDLGGSRPRRIYYWPNTGRLVRVILQPSEQSKLLAAEQRYSKTLEKKEEKHGDIELF